MCQYTDWALGNVWGFVWGGDMHGIVDWRDKRLYGRWGRSFGAGGRGRGRDLVGDRPLRISGSSFGLYEGQRLSWFYIGACWRFTGEEIKFYFLWFLSICYPVFALRHQTTMTQGHECSGNSLLRASCDPARCTFSRQITPLAREHDDRCRVSFSLNNGVEFVDTATAATTHLIGPFVSLVRTPLDFLRSSRG